MTRALPTRHTSAETHWMATEPAAPAPRSPPPLPPPSPPGCRWRWSPGGQAVSSLSSPPGGGVGGALIPGRRRRRRGGAGADGAEPRRPAGLRG